MIARKSQEDSSDRLQQEGCQKQSNQRPRHRRPLASLYDRNHRSPVAANRFSRQGTYPGPRGLALPLRTFRLGESLVDRTAVDLFRHTGYGCRPASWISGFHESFVFILPLWITCLVTKQSTLSWRFITRAAHIERIISGLSFSVFRR